MQTVIKEVQLSPKMLQTEGDFDINDDGDHPDIL
jgi:hypothetical protein